MADTIRRVSYYYTMVPNRPGAGAKVLGALKDARVNLLAFSGFPEGREAQLDFVPEDRGAFLRVMRKHGFRVSARKTGFLVEGSDRIGAVAALHAKLAKARINVTAMDAVCTRGGRFGALLWVKPKDVAKAKKVLGAR
jgi:hypothetical protein